MDVWTVFARKSKEIDLVMDFDGKFANFAAVKRNN
jgi:hypothetical protein